METSLPSRNEIESLVRGILTTKIDETVDEIVTSIVGNNQTNRTEQTSSNSRQLIKLKQAIYNAKKEGKFYNISTGRKIASNPINRRNNRFVWWDEIGIVRGIDDGNEETSRLIDLLIQEKKKDKKPPSFQPEYIQNEMGENVQIYRSKENGPILVFESDCDISVNTPVVMGVYDEKTKKIKSIHDNGIFEEARKSGLMFRISNSSSSSGYKIEDLTERTTKAIHGLMR